MPRSPTLGSSDVPTRVPSYRRHKPTDQAVVTLNGHDIYLGKWNSKASRDEYDRLIVEWLAAGRCLPRPETDLTVVELVARYWKFCRSYYVKNGVPSPFQSTIRLALRHLRRLYGKTLSRDFGPLPYRAMQEQFIRAGHSRSYIIKLCDVIRRMFKWGASHALVPVTIYQALATVPGPRKGRTAAREPDPVQPVSDVVVEATLPHLSTVVADMVRLQRLLGCRPGEICALRPCDIDRNGEVWSYRPASHKTEHHGRDRVIFIGPRAQEILLPYLLRDAQAFCFSPAESEVKRKDAMRASRKTPVQPSQMDRSKRRPKRKPGVKYNKDSYNHAIRRAVEKANKVRAESGEAPLRHWHPNQLRHSAGTDIRRKFGLEAAQVVLGHAKADVTQIYAERDFARAKEIVRRIG